MERAKDFFDDFQPSLSDKDRILMGRHRKKPEIYKSQILLPRNCRNFLKMTVSFPYGLTWVFQHYDTSEVCLNFFSFLILRMYF